MIFGSFHYVPILKAKRGEKVALLAIDPAIRPLITPLLEIVEWSHDKAPTLAAHLDTAFKNLAECVHAYSRCFLDAREVAAEGPKAAVAVFSRAASAGIAFTPVTGISRTADVAATLSYRDHGLALRLTREELEEGGLEHSLRSFMSRHNLAHEETDLIVDLGPVSDFVVDGVTALTEAFLAEVTDHRSWRTLTVSSCAFPLNMGGVDRRSHSLVERVDWLAWRDGLFARRQSLPRLPAFSDYAIQHPKGVEGFDPRLMQVSASVRYTLPDAWLLIKGESTRAVAARLQFPEIAKQLVYGHLRHQFAGVEHCAGCAAIKKAADGFSGFGSAEVWRRLGTIHHLTQVIQDLSALPAT